MWIICFTVQHEILVLSHKPHSITFFDSIKEIKKQKLYTVSQKCAAVVENVITCILCNSNRVIITNFDIFSACFSICCWRNLCGESGFSRWILYLNWWVMLEFMISSAFAIILKCAAVPRKSAEKSAIRC